MTGIDIKTTTSPCDANAHARSPVAAGQLSAALRLLLKNHGQRSNTLF